MSPITIRPFDPESATDSEQQALFDFKRTLHAESRPDMPTLRREELAQMWGQLPPIIHRWAWVAYGEDGQWLGLSALFTADVEGNTHVSQGEVSVLPAWRRQGLGSRLLRLVAERSAAEGRTLLLLASQATVPAGAAFLRAMGATPGQDANLNQLELATLDRSLLDAWMADGEGQARFALEWHEGAYPDSLIDDMVVLYLATNDRPLDELAIGRTEWSPELLRTMEASLLGRATTRWTAIVRERATGRAAGFTEMTMHPEYADYASQGYTVVHRDFRGNRLGRWLKAAMLQRLLADHPEIGFVRTGNAASNAPMLRINDALGFRPVESQTAWQVSSVDLAERLKDAERDNSGSI